LPYMYSLKHKKFKNRYYLIQKPDYIVYLKNKSINNSRLNLFFTKSNLHISVVTSKILLFSLSIGEYQSLIGSNRAL